MPTNVERIQALFLAAAEISNPADRARFLDGACDGDAEVRSRVEALLRAHDQPDSLLDHPVVAVLDADNGATQALTGAPEAGVAVSQTAGGVNGASDDEPLTFLTPPTRPDSLGRIGHYEVLQVLGRGGFGIVFRAFDEMLQRVVALKVMAPQLAATSPARKRFLREARSSAQVRHENVVQVYEVAEQPLPYLAMEFIPGETLQQLLDRVGPLDVPEVLRIGRQIAEGLAAAHATDLIHRDIKPGNMLLEGGQHKVKITDFGLARAADDASISQSGIIAGTPMYMAPEQAEGKTLDQRADLFSLGSVLYQMVAGRPPFRANSTVAVLKRVVEDKPRAIREIIPETPQWLCDIIAKLHAKSPDDRFQSAREVADVLADCEAQLKANSKLKDYSRIPRSKSQPFGRRKWVAAAAAVLLLPVVALVATEFAGVTKLFHGRGELLPNQPGSDPQAKVGASWNGWPADAPPPAIAPFDAAQARAHQEVWAKYFDVPIEIENSIGMKLRLIPPGKFTMGSADGELGRWLHEGPQHVVTITKPFALASQHVTVGQFKAFVNAQAYQTNAERNGGAHRYGRNVEFKNYPETNWRNPGFAQTDDHPVVCVDWNDARAFCDWLSEKEGRTYTLPTEAQWEHACRAGSMTRFCFGNDDADLQNYAWYNRNSAEQTHPVGQKKPNPWGLYDVHGNAWHWCLDGIRSYSSDAVQDPFRDEPIGMLRGGAWFFGASACRSAVRSPCGSDHRDNSMGFRVAIVGDLKAKVPHR